MRAAGRGGGALVLFAGLAAAAVVWALILFASLARQPGLEGLLTGVFGGGMVALLIAAASAWTTLAFVRAGARKEEAAKDIAPHPLQGQLADTLVELETIRQQTKLGIIARAAVLVPLGSGAGVALWWVLREPAEPFDPMELLSFVVVGALAGYSWASKGLSSAYRRLYKERVMPQLAAQFGALTWRIGQPPMDELARWRLFPAFDSVRADDEIVGEYRGLPTSLVELHLTHGSGKKRRSVFNGLLATVTLPRALRGVTVVVGDKGPFGDLAERILGREGERVVLEDPGFENVYDVLGTDQIGARALLTPAFMQRFLALAQSGRFGKPVALAHDNRLLLALPTLHGDLFEPPSYWQPAASRDSLKRLSADIRRVLDAADAVIDLDQAARRAAPA